MKVQISALPFGETTDIDGPSHFDTAMLQRGKVGRRRDHQSAGILEADEATVKQVIDTGRQQQAVFTIEVLLVGGVAPWLAMAGDSVNRVFDLGDSASLLYLHHALFEDTLDGPVSEDDVRAGGMMSLTDDKRAELLMAHYNDTFQLILYHWKARNRLFVYVLIVLAFMAVDGMSPGQLGKAVNLYVNKAVSAPGQANAIALDLGVIGSAFWFLLLTLVIQYYQRSIHVDRQYRYIQALEEQFRNAGGEFLARESTSYFSRTGEAKGDGDQRPLYLRAVGGIYVHAFPWLLIVLVSWKLIVETTTSASGHREPLFFDILVGIVLTAYNIVYMLWERQNQHHAMSPAREKAVSAGK